MPQEAFSVRERIPVRFAQQLAQAPALQQQREQLFSMLDTLLPRSGFTAWAGDSDGTCLSCLDYLQIKGVPVPDALSIVGFDDSFEAFLRRLTTYNFNGAAYMRAMLAHVLRPHDSGASREPGGFTTIPGYVVERWSAGPPVR
jgi:DNA-binding LacI/PurR family transcriptional regulator